MFARYLLRSVAFVAALVMTVTGAAAFDETKYPDWSGQWWRPRGVGFQWDQTKPPGRGQQAPLTPQYQAVLEASLADQAAGGQGGDNLVTCRTNGMPRMMSVAWPIEFVILPNITYVHFEVFMPRRIYTDGRNFPEAAEPGYMGYSIGKWLDTDGDGRFDTSKWRPAISRGRAPTSRAAYRCTTTMNRSSWSASISTKPTPTSCITTSRRSTMR